MGDEGAADQPLAKRPRPSDLKRVAEIVMVLSAMGQMRGGREPEAVEKAMAAEAREKLAEVCEGGMKPKDLVSREAVRVLVEDLGLNRSRDPMMGFRPPKMSIADKLQLTKRKMEESKGLASHSSVYSSQHHLGGFGANSELHGTVSHGTPKFLSDRQSPMALSAGGFQSVSPGMNVSAVTSANSLKQSHGEQPQLSSSSIKSSATPLEKGSLSAQTRAETQILKFDTQFNGPPYSTQGPATTEKSPATPSVQLTPAALVKPEGAPANSVQAYHQLTGNQEAKASSEVQAVNLPIGHQPAEGVVFISGPSFVTTHEDISKAVQKLLQPKIFDHPNWAPPSTEYISQPMNCQICKVTITDVESLLVCDACEKGTHLKCLQSYGNKEGIPKAEWHCPKCLIASNGKPLPPKYGRVTRTINPPPKTPNTVAASGSTQKKPPESKVEQQKLTANGSSNSPQLANTSSSTPNRSESTPDVKTACAGETKPGLKNEGGIHTVTSSNNSTENTGVVRGTPSIKTENSDKETKSSGSSPSDMQKETFVATVHPKTESERSCSEHSHDPAARTANQSQVAGESKVDNETEVHTNVEVLTNQNQEISKPNIVELKVPASSRGQPQCEAGGDVAAHDQGNPQSATNFNTNESQNETEVPNNGEVLTNQNQEVSKSSIGELKEPSSSQRQLQHESGCDFTGHDRCNPQMAANSNIESKKPIELKETFGDETSCKILLDSQDKCQDAPDGGVDDGDGSIDCGKHSSLESDVDWIGDAIHVIDEKTHYQSCQVNGVQHKLQDHVLISTSSQKTFPSKLQSLWEDNKTGSKWAVVNLCYYPNDLPEGVSRPSTPAINEVYASQRGSTIVANSICGLCEVLSMDKFKEEVDRRTHLGDANSGLRPLFLCRWVYDESTGIFLSITD